MFNSKFNRRKFLQLSSVCLSTIPVIVVAQDLMEDDPTALSLGYKANSESVDKNKYSNYQSGQKCNDCALFSADDELVGNCAIFVGKKVSAAGWCSAFNAK